MAASVQPIRGTKPDGSVDINIVSGGGGGGGPVTVADGADVTLGAKADAAVTDSTATNTAMSFLKGLVKIFNDVWVSGSHWLQVSIQNATLAVTQAGVWTVGSSLAAAPLAGQAKIAITGTRVQLGANVLVNGVIVAAKAANAADIQIGGSGVNNVEDGTGNSYILAPGTSVSFAVTNTNVLYINGTAGDIVSFAGS